MIAIKNVNTQIKNALIVSFDFLIYSTLKLNPNSFIADYFRRKTYNPYDCTNVF